MNRSLITQVDHKDTLSIISFCYFTTKSSVVLDKKSISYKHNHELILKQTTIMRSQLKTTDNFFLPRRDLNHDPLELKASGQPISNADPILCNSIRGGRGVVPGVAPGQNGTVHKDKGITERRVEVYNNFILLVKNTIRGGLSEFFIFQQINFRSK